MSELPPCPFVKLSTEAIAQFLKEGDERLENQGFLDADATFWRHVLQQLHAYAALPERKI